MWLQRKAERRPSPALDPVTTHGEWVKIKKGNETIRAYVAYPERKTKAPAVIVIHEIFGLTDWEPTVADRLAKEGFVAIVPDLLSSKHGQSPKDPDEGRKLVGELEPDRITADLECHLRLRERPARGGQGSDRDHRVLLGRGPELPLRHQQPQPQGCRGGLRPRARHRRHQADQGAGARHLRRERRADQRQPARCGRQDAVGGKTFTSEVYPGTGHGFLKPGRQGSDGPQVEKAWKRILEFYRARLGK